MIEWTIIVSNVLDDGSIEIERMFGGKVTKHIVPVKVAQKKIQNPRIGQVYRVKGTGEVEALAQNDEVEFLTQLYRNR